jgi:hypothetical protein
MLTLSAPGAKGIADIWKAAGSPAQVRGIATNVAGWNAWTKTPGEFENTPDGQYNKAQDEKRYINLIGAQLAANGMPNHAIIDTGRNAVQGLRLEWGDWCNVKGAGFGVRPTSNTGDALADAFVWVKPGGESDGVSDSSAPRYDSFCGKSDGMIILPFLPPWKISLMNPVQLLAHLHKLDNGTRPTLRLWLRMPFLPSKGGMCDSAECCNILVYGFHMGHPRNEQSRVVPFLSMVTVFVTQKLSCGERKHLIFLWRSGGVRVEIKRGKIGALKTHLRGCCK